MGHVRPAAIVFDVIVVIVVVLFVVVIVIVVLVVVVLIVDVVLVIIILVVNFLDVIIMSGWLIWRGIQMYPQSGLMIRIRMCPPNQMFFFSFSKMGLTPA